MGFENIIEAFYPNQKAEGGQRHIDQGNSLLNIREGLLNNIISAGREGFDTSRFTKMGKREKKLINGLEAKYNRLVSDYATSYKNFLVEHKELESQVTSCKSKCLERHNNKVDDYSNKRKSCVAGCQIKGPFIAECKDTYKGMRNQINKKCGNITPGKCSDGTITIGQEKYVGGSNYSDGSGKTIKDGCCECGGGTGGKPYGEINGQHLKRCTDIASAFGLEKGSGQDKAYQLACKQAAGIETGRTSQFYKKYNAIEAKNQKISDEAQSLYDQINHLDGVNKQLQSTTSDSETQLNSDLSSFEEKYAKLMELGGKEGKDPTIEAQRNSIMLKKQAEEMSFYFMSILAIVLVVTTIINFRRAI
ncbi:MAG: hypothetical protein CXT73_05945 [Methanobacteriota archaeon]|nr:MAG: hypothetical protein CXT73_05945 [Euryarchaeota archaeon]